MHLLKHNFYIVIIALVLIVTGCSKHDSVVQDPFDPSVAKQIKNESYGSNSLQRADIYLPANRSAATRTMVLIHGGFWIAGDKSDMDSLLNTIGKADPSLCIVNMNYRLADGTAANYHPAQMTDVKLLLDHLQQNASTWHIGNSIALTGVSSGGQIAMLYTYAYDSAMRVKSVASVIGPTNFADPYYTTNPSFQNIVLNLFGKTWQQDSTLYINASPLYRVTASAPPTFLAYGGSDVLIPVSSANAMHLKLEALNVQHEYWFYPAENHDLTQPTILDIIKNMAAFYKKYL